MMATKYTLRKLQEHLNYEITMLVGAWTLIHKGDSAISTTLSPNLRNKIVANAAKETFCLHARSLMEFFGETRSRANSAASFAVQTYTPAQRNKFYIKKLNNQISHLLDGRITCWRDKINETDRLAYLAWIKVELVRWKSNLELTYCNIIIDDIEYCELALMVTADTVLSTTNVISST
jgi:hypothetical protein